MRTCARCGEPSGGAYRCEACKGQGSEKIEMQFLSDIFSPCPSCQGKRFRDEVLEITGDVILKKLGGLPKEEEHCAFLAGETLQEALNDYMIKQTRRP